MLDRLWIRLLLGMSLALALAVGTVALLVNRATLETFSDYVEDVSTSRADRVENVLTRHYQRSQSWAAVDSTIQLVADLTSQRVVLADESGRVVADSQNQLAGQRVQPDWAGEPIIISHQEKPVGSVYLDPLRPPNRVDNRGQAFLAATNEYLFWAAAVGLLAALILSLLLSRWLVAPLEALTRAARRMARGDLSQKIDVRIGGEVGALARAFNSTAASLSRVEGLRRRMVADIAHELRTPLTNIRGYLEAIQDGVAKPDEATLSVLRNELAQLTRLVDDLQDLALVEAGQLRLSREEIDLGELLRRELQAVLPQADMLDVELALQTPRGLPTITADAGRLGQAISNLLHNALGHTPPGGRITAAVSSEDDSVVVRVSDTGSGIPPEHLPHIFERFYRGDQSRARSAAGAEPGGARLVGRGGYGLGLTICRELVQAHGGQISARSALGDGSEFTIRLPVAGPEPAARLEHSPMASQAQDRLRPATRVDLLWTGVLVAALFGATAGLIETALLGLAERKTGSFVDLFGYAVLIDATAFGVLGGLGSLLAGALARAFHRRFDLPRQIATWAPTGCLLVGLMAYLRWRQLHNRDEVAGEPQALFGQVAIVGLAVLVALLASALLAPRPGSGVRALIFGRRMAPAALAVLIGLAAVGVVRDLGGRGLGLGASVGSAIPSLQAPSSSGPPSQSGLAANQSGGISSAGSGAPVGSSGKPQTGATNSGAGLSGSREPNVMLVTIDSLRADHLGFVGYPKARTANLDRLAAEGVYFSNAIVNLPGSNPSHASIFTGTYPATHGIYLHMVDMLSRDVPTIAESFAANGYITAGIFSWLSFESAYSGLDRGYQLYSDMTINRPAYLSDSRTSTLAATYKRLKTLLALPGAMDRQMALSQQVEDQLDGKADVTTDAVISWLKENQARTRASAQPFFLWVHYFDPHYPYTPPPPFDEIEPDDCDDCLDGSMSTIRRIEAELHPEFSPAQINRLLQYYDGEIAFTDRELGRLIQSMNSLGLDENTLIVVLGDHGESFGEHDQWLHGGSLHDPEVHVPLIMRLPGQLPAGKVVDAVVQQIDVMPTILDLLGMPVPPKVEGSSMLPLIRDQADGRERYAISELSERSVISLITREWRLLKNTDEGSVELYRTQEDPDGLRDLADAEPEVVAELEELLERWRATHP